MWLLGATRCKQIFAMMDICSSETFMQSKWVKHLKICLKSSTFPMITPSALPPWPPHPLHTPSSCSAPLCTSFTPLCPSAPSVPPPCPLCPPYALCAPSTLPSMSPLYPHALCAFVCTRHALHSKF